LGEAEDEALMGVENEEACKNLRLRCGE